MAFVTWPIGASTVGVFTDVQKNGLASLQALDLLVAGTGFEPVTFGL
jgi:hypothetical protein